MKPLFLYVSFLFISILHANNPLPTQVTHFIYVKVELRESRVAKEKEELAQQRASLQRMKEELEVAKREADQMRNEMERKEEERRQKYTAEMGTLQANKEGLARDMRSWEDEKHAIYKTIADEKSYVPSIIK
jgi:chromosome segregation ATPase